MDELVDVRDGGSGERTGEVVWKSEAHRLGLWHRCFHCWVFGADDGGSYLLVQRRSTTKGTWPGYLDVTAAGHLGAGEEPLDGLQEEEVEAVLRIGLYDAVLLETAGSAPAREYREGEVSETRVRVSDFVPNTDDYLRRVVLAARDALGGGRVERIF